MRKRVDYAIDKIGQRDIFNVDIVETLDLASAQKRQPPSGWLREYSSVNMEAERSNFLKQQTGHQPKGNSSSKSQISKCPSLETLIQQIDENSEELNKIGQVDFDIFKVTKVIGR